MLQSVNLALGFTIWYLNKKENLTADILTQRTSKLLESDSILEDQTQSNS